MKHRQKQTAALFIGASLLCTVLNAPLPLLRQSKTAITASAAEGYEISGYMNKSAEWYGTSEALGIAADVLKYQLSDGGWRKAMSDTSQTGSWAKSTIDNDGTTTEIRFLARCYQQTRDSRYYDALIRGIDLLLNGQYSNGGWPQIFNDAGTYHAHITFNDGAMVHVLNIMQEIRDKKGDFTFIDDNRAKRAAAAVQKAIDCILKMQIEVNGVKTAWGQQHDEFTLAPAPARAYELPSICTSESVGIIQFLRAEANGNADIIAASNAAIEWFKKVQLNGIKVVSQNNDRVVVQDANASPLWARFYDIQTMKPLFVDRDGSIHWNMSELSQERRTGYSWYGNWGKNVVNLAPLSDVPPEPVILKSDLISALEVLDPENTADWSIQSGLHAGTKIFGDRAYTFTSVPPCEENTEWITIPCDAKNLSGDLAKLTAAKDLFVEVYLDTRLSAIPAWMQDFQPIANAEAISDNGGIFQIYTMTLPMGSTLTLGANGQSGNVVQYGVAVSEFEMPPAEITTTTEETTATTTTTTTTTTAAEQKHGQKQSGKGQQHDNSPQEDLSRPKGQSRTRPQKLVGNHIEQDA